MEAAYTVALVGFAQHESATFESFFRLAARRPPAYRVQEEVLDAQLLLVNADNAHSRDAPVATAVRISVPISISRSKSCISFSISRWMSSVTAKLMRKRSAGSRRRCCLKSPVFARVSLLNSR